MASTGACRARHCVRYDLPVTRHDPHNGAAGQPSRQSVPVHLFQFRGRPPAREQRGRSPSTLPPRDRAARATLGRRVRPGVPEGRCCGIGV